MLQLFKLIESVPFFACNYIKKEYKMSPPFPFVSMIGNSHLTVLTKKKSILSVQLQKKKDDSILKKSNDALILINNNDNNI